MNDVEEPEKTIHEQQQELNLQKKVLLKKMLLPNANLTVIAEDWLDLARKYKRIDSKLNHAFCMVNYRECGGLAPLPKEKVDWQKRADMK